MKKIIERLRSIMIDRLAGLMNWNSDVVCYADRDHSIGWRDHLRWWIENRLSELFQLIYSGSTKELRSVEHGEIPAEYMNDRQRAYAAALQGNFSQFFSANGPDREFLMWIHERLEHVHGENPLTDYMHRLRAIIAEMPAKRRTSSVGQGGDSLEQLQLSIVENEL